MNTIKVDCNVITGSQPEFNLILPDDAPVCTDFELDDEAVLAKMSGTPVSALTTDVTDSADFIDVRATSEATTALGDPVSKLLPCHLHVSQRADAIPEDLLKDDFEFADDGRVIIRYKPGSLPSVIRDAERVLARTGKYFQRGGVMVEVRVSPATGEAEVHDVSQAGLILALATASVWMRLTKSTWTQVDPIERICTTMVKAGRYERLRDLRGLARQAFLRPDGSLCQSPGYDAATGVFGAFEAGDFQVSEAPTMEQAQEALKLLQDVVSDFAFAQGQDRSAAISALITAAIRPSLASAPMFHIRAPQIASGKSYLCELITAFATPQRGSPVPFPRREEECSKLLQAQLMRAPAVIEFDNLNDDLKAHESLCTALTSEYREGRVLGHSKVVKVSTRVLFLSSGNNVGPVADMTRRCITIQLDPQCETPAARVFSRPDLVGDIRRDRTMYVAATLTVVRAWIAAGRPRSPAKPLASFTEWNDLCVMPLLWLGMTDPVKSVFDAMEADPDRVQLGEFLTGWRGKFGSSPVMVRDAVMRSTTGLPDSDEFFEVLEGIAGDRGAINTKKLGKWITRHAGRVVGGLRIVKAAKTRNVENWKVESVPSVESVTKASAAELSSAAMHDR